MSRALTKKARNNGAFRMMLAISRHSFAEGKISYYSSDVGSWSSTLNTTSGTHSKYLTSLVRTIPTVACCARATTHDSERPMTAPGHEGVQVSGLGWLFARQLVFFNLKKGCSSGMFPSATSMGHDDITDDFMMTLWRHCNIIDDITVFLLYTSIRIRPLSAPGPLAPPCLM